MAKESDQSGLMEILDWVYEKAVGGMPGLDSAYELAEDHLRGDGSLEDQVNSLIRWQNTKAATSGFLSGIGGFLTMPVTIPANLGSVWFVQIRMIAAIACMGGYDLRDDRVKTLVYACLTTSAAKDILKHAGIDVSKKLAKGALNNLSGKVIRKINKAVGFRLLTKFGEKGVVNLHKLIPLAGGVVGAIVDASATNTIGNIARDTFITLEEQHCEGDPIGCTGIAIQ